MPLLSSLSSRPPANIAAVLMPHETRVNAWRGEEGLASGYNRCTAAQDAYYCKHNTNKTSPKNASLRFAGKYLVGNLGAAVLEFV